MELFKRAADYIRGILNGGNKKKLIEGFVMIIIFGVILIIAGGSIFSDGKKVQPEKQGSVDRTAETYEEEGKQDMERKLEAILSQIDGAGRVNVMVTYLSGKEIIPALDIKSNDNDTQEKDSGGGTRQVKQNESEKKIAYEEGQGGIKKPVVIKEINPSVKGVVVVADGASDVKVRESLSRALQVLLELPLHKVQVFERKK